LGNEEEVNRDDLRVKPDVYMAALMDEVNEHLVELIDKMDAVNKQSALPIKFYTTPETAILAATPDEPNSPDTITSMPSEATWTALTAYSFRVLVKPTSANSTGYLYECTTAGTSGGTEPAWPTTVGNTVTDGTVIWTCISAAGYQAHTIYETLKRMAPGITIINDGNNTIFVISTSEGERWTPENPIFPGESRTFDNVYELRLRSPTVGDVTNFTGGVYRITEYKVILANTGLKPLVLDYSRIVAIIGSANLMTIVAALFGLPMNAVFDSEDATSLGANATFVGDTRDFRFSRLGFMSAIAFSSRASADLGFKIEQSHNGTNWDFEDAVTTVGGTGSRIKAAIAARYARVSYTNGIFPTVNLRIGSRAMIS